MVLIIGGAYQGKLDFAQATLGVTEGEVYTCSGTDIDFSKHCIYGLEEFAYACVKAGMEPADYFKENHEFWKDSILICRDIFCGVVPMDTDQREWRQATGRLCQYLSKEADQVSRIFCGLEQRLK